MTRIQFGFTMPAEQENKTHRATYIEDLHRALDLVSGHFDSAWMIDHLTEVLEGFTTLTYMAALHPKLKFGNVVLCQSFRNPALVATMGATLQFLSRGRFILGIGSGGNGNAEEYHAYGYDFPAPSVRVQQLEEALQIIKALWTQERATFDGRYYQVRDAICEPKPDPLPPVMVGAFSPKMLRLTARYADWWNVSSTGPSAYQAMQQDFERACLEIGRDSAGVRRSWCGGCVCARTQQQAELIGGDRYSAHNTEDDFGFVGTPQQIVDQMQPFIEMGVDYFMLDCGGFPDPTTLELLVSEVLPALND